MVTINLLCCIHTGAFLSAGSEFHEYRHRQNCQLWDKFPYVLESSVSDHCGSGAAISASEQFILVHVVFTKHSYKNVIIANNSGSNLITLVFLYVSMQRDIACSSCLLFSTLTILCHDSVLSLSFRLILPL